MAGADLSGVYRVILEIFFIEEAVFVAYEAVTCDIGWVELDLDLYILGYCDQRSAHLIHQHPFAS